MDLRLLVTVFLSVFVAELGDKTQLATFGLAASSTGGRWIVFLGSAAALVSTSLIAVAAGAALGKIVSPIWHMGWGAEDMKASYQKQLDMGTKFFTPLTPLPWASPNFYYAYVEGPDHALYFSDETKIYRLAGE